MNHRLTPPRTASTIPEGPRSAVEARRLRLLSELGRGGFGVVWLAELLATGGFRKEVAIKVLNREDGDGAIARRLRDEARILSLIRHPGVVQVDDLIQVDGRWAVVMEYIPGVDLQKVTAAGPLAPRIGLEITSQIARVLKAAWETAGPNAQPLHIIHRDIKPPNLRVTAAGAVKLLDFGVARAEFNDRESQTTAGTFGTVPFMSPERLEWIDGPEGDIYALGAVLFELITGEPLGRTNAQPERHKEKLETVRQRLAPVLPKRDPGVGTLLLDLLAYEPGARPTPRVLEDRCDTLAEQLGGERLKRWAEREVPRLMAANAAAGSSTTPPVLVEQDSGVFSSAMKRGGGGSAPTSADTLPEGKSKGPKRSTWIPMMLLGATVPTVSVIIGLLVARKVWMPAGYPPPPLLPTHEVAAPQPAQPVQPLANTAPTDGTSTTATSPEPTLPAPTPVTAPTTTTATPTTPDAAPTTVPATPSTPAPAAASPVTAPTTAAPQVTRTVNTATDPVRPARPVTVTSLGGAHMNARRPASAAPASTQASPPVVETEVKASDPAPIPTTAVVKVGGSAKVALIMGGVETPLPNDKVKPGTYSVRVMYGNEIETLQRTIRVEAGKIYTLSCDGGATNCGWNWE